MVSVVCLFVCLLASTCLLEKPEVARAPTISDLASTGYGVFPHRFSAGYGRLGMLGETSCWIAVSYEAKAFGVAQRGAGDRLNQ